MSKNVKKMFLSFPVNHKFLEGFFFFFSLKSLWKVLLIYSNVTSNNMFVLDRFQLLKYFHI